jgi:hypothetical protein
LKACGGQRLLAIPWTALLLPVAVLVVVGAVAAGLIALLLYLDVG